MKKKAVLLLSVIIIISVTLTSCTNTGSFTLNSPDPIVSDSVSTAFHTKSNSSENVEKTDFLSLDFDKKTFSVSVKDKTTGHVWSSLPEKNNSSAFAFEATLYTQNGIYTLDTQKNSVAINSASYDIKDKILSVNYVLSNDENTAKLSSTELSKDDIYVGFSVSYSLSGQSLTVTTDCSQLVCTPGGFVKCISFLPYFGASYEAEKDDWIFVPDGSGAIMNTAESYNDLGSVSIDVYGNDPYYEKEKKASAVVPVFGIKSENSAFSAVITDGDALAQINATGISEDSPGMAGATFNITPSAINENNVIYGKPYDGKISVVYKFLSKGNANYTAMATVAREEFISKGYLSSSLCSSEDNIPFCLTVVGSFEKTNLATTVQTQNILSVLKGKGVNNINLIYKGLLSGGLLQNNLYNARILSSIGGKSGFNELYNYTEKQNYNMSVGVNILSSYSGFISSEKDILGNSAQTLLRNDMALRTAENNRLSSRISKSVADKGKVNSSASLYLGDEYYNYNLIKLNSFSDKFSSFLSGNFTDMCDGYTITDAGNILYSSSDFNRQQSLELIKTKLSAATGYGKLTVENGNIYALYNAFQVSGMSFDTYYKESDNYEPVPFAQAVLHGYMQYTGKPVDAADSLYRFDMLQSIEYGALPSFEWVFNDSSIYYYGYYVLSEKISEIVDFYNNANQILSDLSDKTITNHKKITYDSKGRELTGVYCTTYSNGAEIYVNYTGNAVTTSGNIVIEPYNCIRIDR